MQKFDRGLVWFRGPLCFEDEKKYWRVQLHSHDLIQHWAGGKSPRRLFAFLLGCGHSWPRAPSIEPTCLSWVLTWHCSCNSAPSSLSLNLASCSSSNLIHWQQCLVAHFRAFWCDHRTSKSHLGVYRESIEKYGKHILQQISLRQQYRWEVVELQPGKLQVYTPQPPALQPGVRRLCSIFPPLPGLACDVFAHSRVRGLANIAAVSPPPVEAEAMLVVPAGHDRGQHHLVGGPIGFRIKLIDIFTRLQDNSPDTVVRYPISVFEMDDVRRGLPGKNTLLTDGGNSMTGFLSTIFGLRFRANWYECGTVRVGRAALEPRVE